jgi:polyferredoxin
MITGLPTWLFLLGLTVVSLASIAAVLIEPRRPRDRAARPPRDLLRHRSLRRLLGWRPFRWSMQMACVVLFFLIIATGLFGRQQGAGNLATVLTWTYWWMLLVLGTLLLGKAWCYVCPWDALAGWLARLAWWGPARWPLAADRPWPRALANLYPAVGLFVLLTWLELGYGVTTRPALTALLGLLMFFLAFVPALVFERSAFCRYACLVGRISGLYALVAPLELRARDQAICRSCATRDCYFGNTHGLPCPTWQYLGGMSKNTYCILCGECLFTCPRDNVALNLRPFGADLYKASPIRSDEATMVIVMLSMSTFHGFTMTPAWHLGVTRIAQYARLPYLAAFTVGMASFLLALAAGYLLAVFVAARLAPPRGTGLRYLAMRYAYALLPTTLFYHLAHNTMHFSAEAAALVPVASDPFGWGWDLWGTARALPGALLAPGVVSTVMVALVVIGHCWSLGLTRHIAAHLFTDPRAARRSRTPIVVGLLLYALLNLWTMAQPMDMRTGL